MRNDNEVKGYQKGFLKSIGISVEEILTLNSTDLWNFINSFCRLNDIALIIDEEERLLLGNFSSLNKEDQKKVVDNFCEIALNIRADLKRDL